MTATDSSVEYGVQHSQGQRAGAYVLRRIAVKQGLLKETLGTLWRLQKETQTAPRLAQVLPKEFTDAVVEATGLPVRAFDAAAMEQLDRVAAFVRSDGDAVDDNIKAAEYLISSGRISLFSR